MVQAERQQALSVPKIIGPKSPALLMTWPRALIPMAKTGQISGMTRPTRPRTTVVIIGTKRCRQKKGQRVGQADIVKTLMQHPDDDPGDHRAEDPGVDRLNADNILDVVRFEDGGIGGRQNAFGRQPEVNRQIHHGIADKTGKRGDAFVFRASPSGMAIQNITGRKLKAKEPTLPIQMNTACSSGTSSHGRSVRTSWLLESCRSPA